jgi:hypothetical protein
VNSALSVSGAVGQRAITHLLGLRAGTLTIDQAVEAAFERIERCVPGRGPEWPSVFGDR